jgi:pyrimidine operon attenuation protein/uracil phosphoribosyltransferase
METLADTKQVGRLVDDLAERIRAEMADSPRWAMVGILRRGDVLAHRLADKLKPDHIGSVDIALYRDDLSELGPQPVVRTTNIDFDLDGTDVVLVDDVLMTGRSVRAAIQSLIDYGRPRRIKLAVLVDRGGRELPIAADFIGRTIEAPDTLVSVELKPTDEHDRITLRCRCPNAPE